MKKIFGLTLVSILVLVFAGCGDENDTDNDTAQLTIKNESSYELTDVLWNNVSFAGIRPGTSAVMTVQSGSGYIRFKPALNPINVRTSQLVVIEKGQQEEFVFLNNTIVVNENNINNNGTLSSFSGVPQIAVRQSSTAISQNGDFDFGTILIGTTSEITFTIENSGGETLSIDPVNGNRVNLTENASGFFNVNMQPVSQTIASGNSSTFTIRFNPTTEGNNYNAAVRIVTNSHTNNEFVFRVTGNGRAFQTGDEVPLIAIKQGDTSIAQYGEFDFGTVRLSTSRDFTFTIENSGGANLVLETVNGSRINLADNASGFFSVNLQPLSPTIAPGNSAAFTIRFTPTTVGNDFNAAVQIKTNCVINGEFTFRVTGNGSNSYSIGDEGPGGGMVFFAQGGQFKECSGELGVTEWSGATALAADHRGNGFTDWRLPDRSELDQMYQNLHRNNLGGFFGGIYWSSTEGIGVSNTTGTWVQNFWASSTSYYYNYSYTMSLYSGAQAVAWTGNSNSFRVRAVRSFTMQ